MREEKGLRKHYKIYTFDALTRIAMKLNVIDIFYFEFPRHCIPITNLNEVDNELKKKNDFGLSTRAKPTYSRWLTHYNIRMFNEKINLLKHF